MTEDDLDSLFAAARAAPPRPPAALDARVLADAAAELGRRPLAPVHAARPRFWAVLSGLFGGTGALAGMATATVAGFYIGFAQPMETGLVSAVLGGAAAEIDMMPGIDALLDEAP